MKSTMEKNTGRISSDRRETKETEIVVPYEPVPIKDISLNYL